KKRRRNINKNLDNLDKYLTITTTKILSGFFVRISISFNLWFSCLFYPDNPDNRLFHYSKLYSKTILEISLFNQNLGQNLGQD
ncbi:MAG: hypothetical protein RXO36_07570, partial [Candidatus Nanopusillus acidilobi]